jgi:hypothetical protein
MGRPPTALNQHEKRIIRLSSGRQNKCVGYIAKKIQTGRGDEADGPSQMAVYRYRKSLNLKPFHVISKPYKSPLHRENRLWFTEYLRAWGEDDFLHCCCSDEFFIWVHQKPNSQNDRVWALKIDEIAENERYRSLVSHSACIGLFVCFSVRRMMWVIKDQGQSWNGEYFRQTYHRESFTLRK